MCHGTARKVLARVLQTLQCRARHVKNDQCKQESSKMLHSIQCNCHRCMHMWSRRKMPAHVWP